MKIKTIAISIILLFSVSVRAQVLHAFIFCNTDDPKLKQCAKSNLGRIGPFASQIAHALKMPYVVHEVLGGDFEAGTFVKTIRDAHIRPEDVVILYVNSHGENASNIPDNFPVVWVPDQNVLFSATKLHLLASAMHPRALITIVEACNGVEKIDLQKIYIIGQGRENDSTEIEKRNFAVENAAIKKIFSVPMNFMICSGNKGKVTYGSILGSYFTTNFVNAFQETIQLPAGNKYVCMDSVLKRASILTYKQVKKAYHPIWAKVKGNMINMIQQGDTVNFQLPPALDDINNDFDQYTDAPEISGLLELRAEKDKLSAFNRIRYHPEKYQANLSILNSEHGTPIDSVVYYLDHSMPQPEVCVKTGPPFNLMFRVIRGFEVKAKVYHHDGLIEELYGDLRDQDEINEDNSQ